MLPFFLAQIIFFIFSIYLTIFWDFSNNIIIYSYIFPLILIQIIFIQIIQIIHHRIILRDLGPFPSNAFGGI